MTVRDQVIEIIAEQMGVKKNQINDDTDVANDLGADSLDTVQLVMEMEEEFDITVPDEEAERLLTVRQYVDYFEQHSK